MQKIDTRTLLDKMLKAASKSLENKWPQIRDLARSAFGNYARNIKEIQAMKKKGSITETQARLQLDIQKNAIKTILLTEEGLGILAVEAALNAALDAIRSTVNAAIGWALL